MRRAESIAAAMEELGFQPSDAARSLKTGRTLAIGLVVPDVTNPFFAAVVKGAESVANDAGYSVVLCNTDESPAREHDVLAALRGRVDGLLLAPARDDAETAESLAALRVPVVLVDRTLPQPGPTDAVLVDNAGGATSAARHLLELGHRPSPSSPARWTRRPAPSATTRSSPRAPTPVSTCWSTTASSASRVATRRRCACSVAPGHPPPCSPPTT